MMKTTLLSLFFGATLAAGVVLAQESTPPSSPARGFGGRGGGRGGRGRSDAKPLDENVTIRIKGTVASGVSIDITFTGCGPTFSLNQQFGEIEVAGNKQSIIGYCNVDIGLVGGTYNVQYAVGCQMPTVTSGSGDGAATIQYRNIGTASTLALKLGQTVTASNSNNQGLTVSLAAAAK